MTVWRTCTRSPRASLRRVVLAEPARRAAALGVLERGDGVVLDDLAELRRPPQLRGLRLRVDRHELGVEDLLDAAVHEDLEPDVVPWLRRLRGLRRRLDERGARA